MFYKMYIIYIKYIIYADIEPLIWKVDNCKNNIEKSSTTKVGKHIPCGYLVLTIWAFDHIENRESLYRGEDSIKKFCRSLREHAKNVIDFTKKKNLLSQKKN